MVAVPSVERIDVLQELEVERACRVEQILFDENEFTLESAACATALARCCTDKRRMYAERKEDDRRDPPGAGIPGCLYFRPGSDAALR